MAVFKLFMLSNDRKNSFLLNDALSGLRQVLATESPLKMTKNVSYFILKLFIFLRYLQSCLGFLVMQENNLIRKTRLISKLLMSQPGKQTIAINILTNISRSKGDEIWSVNIHEKHFS